MLAIIFLSFTVEKSPNLSPEGTVNNFQKAYEEKDFKLFKQLFAESYLKENFPNGDKDINNFLSFGTLEFTDIHTINKKEKDAKVGFITNINDGEDNRKLNWEVKICMEHSKWLIYQMDIK